MSESEYDGNLSNGSPDRTPIQPDLDTVRLIVAEINQGNADAWPRLTNQINNYLTLMAQKNMPHAIRGHVNPSDIVQQTMMEVVQGIDNFRGKTTNEFYAWLNQILRNQSLRTARDLTRKKRDVRKQFSISREGKEDQPKIDLPDDAHTPGSQAISRERLALMEQALTALPEEYEQVIRWRSLEEMSFDKFPRN